MGIRAPLTGRFRATARGERIDWRAIRDTIDLVDVTTRLLGPAPGRQGDRSARRLWWSCPFHEDRNPSLCIKQGGRHWRCWGCGAKGDAIELVRRLNPGWTFPEAIAYATGQSAPSDGHSKPLKPWKLAAAGPVWSSAPTAGPPGKAAERPPDGPTGLDRQEAERLVADASERLWRPEGAAALAYLEGRGLIPETIRRHRLGWTPRVMLPTSNGARFWRASGIVIPWLDGERLALVKIRQIDGREPRYAQAFADRPRIFPGPEAIEPGRPLVVAEGEFDALLLGQELRDLAAVVTLGSASNRPDPTILGEMLAAAPWFVATDNDPAGNKAAGEWPARVIRVQPPGSFKDWTETACAGVNLRRWWSDRLGGTEEPALFTWDELAAWRWGPARDDLTPGIVVDRPDPGRLKAALEGADPHDPYALAERQAIQNETLIDPTVE